MVTYNVVDFAARHRRDVILAQQQDVLLQLLFEALLCVWPVDPLDTVGRSRQKEEDGAQMPRFHREFDAFSPHLIR